MATQIDTRAGGSAPAPGRIAWIVGTVAAIAVWFAVYGQLEPASH